MERLIQMGLLYDFYAPLLTEKRSRCGRYYFTIFRWEIAEEENLRASGARFTAADRGIALKYENALAFTGAIVSAARSGTVSPKD